MKAIWTGDEAEYHGDRVDFDPIYMWPKPAQKPHPPVHVGGAFPGGARRAVRYGNGWIPIGGRDDDLEESIPAFRAMAEQAGRDPKSLEVSIYGVAASEKVIDRYRRIGAERVVFGLPPAPRAEIWPFLDRCAGARDAG